MFLLGGCGKADNRVVLHSRVSIGDLFSVKKHSPHTRHIVTGKISKLKLAAALVSRLDSVSEVYDISDVLDESNSKWQEQWHILFTVKDTSGRVFTGFRCFTYIGGFILGKRESQLYLKNCETDDADGAEFSDDYIAIPIGEILGTYPN